MAVVLTPLCIAEAVPGASPIISNVTHAGDLSTEITDLSAALRERATKLHGVHKSLCDQGQKFRSNFSSERAR